MVSMKTHSDVLNNYIRSTPIQRLNKNVYFKVKESVVSLWNRLEKLVGLLEKAKMKKYWEVL